METKGGERCFRCVCKQTYSKFDPFLKILDLADIGLNIYRYLATKYAQVAGVAPQTAGTGDVFILQNTRDEDLQSASYIKSLDTNKINCPKCKRILTRAKRLIETIPTVNKGNVIGVCDHCRKRAEPRSSCDVCEKIVRKFVSAESKRNQQHPLHIGRSQSDLNLKNITHGPDDSDATAAGFYSTGPKWHEPGPKMRKQFEQKLIPCLIKSQHEGAVHDEIRKHFQNAALIRSRSETFIGTITGLTEEILDNTFHYYFPKGDEHGQPIHGGVMKDIYYDKYGQPVQGRSMPEVFYDEHGQPIQGRRMPEVFYDEHGQPIQGRRMPEVFYDEHGQPIQGRRVPEVFYDEHGQPIQGRRVPEVFYDEHGQPIQGRRVPEVFYDEHGQPIQGRRVPEVFYDEHGQPIQGRRMPEVFYDEHGQPIQGRRVPEVFYDEHGQPIQGRRMPGVYYDEHGQPMQGRRIPEVFYDEHGQPVQGRRIPGVFYDKHGQPIQGRRMPEVLYDEHLQPIQGRRMPGVYYDEHGQPMQGRRMPEVFYDEHGQPVQGRRIPGVFYDKHGQPMQGRRMPEVFYDEHGQPMQGRRMPDVFYDEHGQPVQGRRMPEVFYDEHGQPVQGRRKPEVFYDEHGQPVSAGRTSKVFDKHGKRLTRAKSEVYYDQQGRPVQAGRTPDVYYDKHGQPVAKAKSSDKQERTLRGDRPPEVYYDEDGQPTSRGKIPGEYYDDHGRPIQGGRSKGTPQKVLHSSTEIPEPRVHGRGKSAGGGAELDDKNKRPRMGRDEDSAKKLDAAILEGKEKSQLHSRGDARPSARSKDESTHESKRSEGKEKVSKAKDTVALTKDVPKSKQDAMYAAGKSSAEKEKASKATGAGTKDKIAPVKDVPRSKQEAMHPAGKSKAEKDKVSKAPGSGAKDTVAPAKDVPSKVHHKQEGATGSKQEAMQAAGKISVEKEKVPKADVKDHKQKSTDGAKQASGGEKLKGQRLQETMKQKESAEKKFKESDAKDLKKEKTGGDDSKVKSGKQTDGKLVEEKHKEKKQREEMQAGEKPATGKQKGDDVDYDSKIKDAKRMKEEKIKQQKEEEEKKKISRQNEDVDAKSKKKEEDLAAKALHEQNKKKVEEEKQKKANEEQLKKFKDNLKTVPPIPQAAFASDKTDKIIRTAKSEDPRQQIFKIDENMVSNIAKLDNKSFDKPNEELNLKAVQLRKPSHDDNVAKIVTVKPMRDKTAPIKTEKELERLGKVHNLHERVGNEDDQCDICVYAELEYQLQDLTRRKLMKERTNTIVGNKLKKVKDFTKDMKVDEEEPAPTLFKTKCTIEPPNQFQKEQEPPSGVQPHSKQIQADLQPKGVIKYQLSDRSFIEKGWTLLPTEKVVRKMNVYRMRPAHPEFDWFERNKNKRYMEYDTGEKLAEFTDNGRGRWYYRNGRVALEYYDAEDTNAQQRVLIFSSGEPDERGRTHPYTVLGSFDHMGSGVVFDHGGKIRLKYNQSEGIILDRSLGPVSHWKWHSLNDPPVLQQVMIDTQMSHKDPEILKLGDQTDTTRPDNEDMLAIEFDNFIKEKSKKLTQKFKPFQIKMKALKINEQFSLKILDQASVYLIFRDGTTNLKLNLGMLIDHKEIVDTDTAEMGDVANNIEKFPARTDSIAAIQANIDKAQQEARLRLERDRRLCPPVARASVDQLRAAASRPLRRPIHPATSGSTSRKPSHCNLYYNTRII